MGAPQIILICIWAVAVGIGLTEHGKPKEGKYSVFTTLIGIAINTGLLYWGGFFG